MKSKCAEQSQEEICVSPEPGAKQAPHWVCWGCVRRTWARTHPRAVLEGGPDPEQTEIKGKADLGLNEGPEPALSELFSECVQKISEWPPQKMIPWNCSVALCRSRYFGKHQQDLPVVLYPHIPLTESIHSLLILTVNELSGTINKIPPHP